MLDLFKVSNREATDTELSDLFSEIVKRYENSFVGETLAVLMSEILETIFLN